MCGWGGDEFRGGGGSAAPTKRWLQFPKYAKHTNHPQKPEDEDMDFHISGKTQLNMPPGNYDEIKVIPAVFDEFAFPVCVKIQ